MELELFPTNNHRPSRVDPISVPSFERWWARWPKKQGKSDARRHWLNMSAPEKASAWLALDGWERYAAAHGNKYVPFGSSWLFQQRWEDDAPEVTEVHERSRLKGRTGLESALVNMRAQDERKALES